MGAAVSVPSGVQTVIEQAVIIEPGNYLAVGQIVFDPGGAGWRNAVIAVNGKPIAGTSNITPGTGNICFINVSAITYVFGVGELKPGDVVSVDAFQTDGVPLNTTAGLSYIALVKL